MNKEELDNFITSLDMEIHKLVVLRDRLSAISSFAEILPAGTVDSLVNTMNSQISVVLDRIVQRMADKP